MPLRPKRWILILVIKADQPKPKLSLFNHSLRKYKSVKSAYVAHYLCRPKFTAFSRVYYTAIEFIFLVLPSLPPNAYLMLYQSEPAPLAESNYHTFNGTCRAIYALPLESGRKIGLPA